MTAPSTGKGLVNTLKKLTAMLLALIALMLTLAACRKDSDGMKDIISNSDNTVVEQSQNSALNREEMIPEESRDTVLNCVADPKNSQTLYLWEENNMPSTTEYTQNNGSYADDPDFRPYVVTFPVPEGTKIKGAVLICAGGGFQYRSDRNEGTPVAKELSRLGYQSFVVNYRLRPYT